MSLYSRLHREDILQILEAYDIGSLIQYHELKGGSANTNYTVETEKGRYVLTQVEDKSLGESRILADLLLHLENHQFDTSKLIPDKSGAYLTLFKDKPVFLKTYIVGKVISSFSEEVLVRLGQSLANLHQIPTPDFLPHGFPYGEQALTDIDQEISEHPFSSWLSKKQTYVKNSLLPELPKCMIHGDLFDNNVIITKDQTPVIIDFEEVGLYFRVFDLGMAIVGLCCEEGQLVPSKMQALIRGYREIIDLTKQEIDNLRAFVVYGATATAFWRFRQFNIILPTEKLKDTYKEMMGIADQAYGFSNEFI